MTAPALDRAFRLGEATLTEITALVAAATDADGVPPLSEHVLLHLRYGGDQPSMHLLARVDGRLAGYAHLDATDLVEGPSAELVVDPRFRRRGVGSRLVQELLRSADGRLRLWAHGELPGASRLAEQLGFHRSRVLWQMRRSLRSPLPEPELPGGVTVRTFVPGRDEEPFVALNNAAFAGHPDQGQWSVRDVLTREQEPWFDPAGFFLARHDAASDDGRQRPGAERLVGFHWTKVHGGIGLGSSEHGHEPIGEVYVVGVAPDARLHGLGKALTLVGLRYLRSRGLAEVMLYVDDTNKRAVALYEGLGFTRWDVDVTFRRL